MTGRRAFVVGALFGVLGPLLAVMALRVSQRSAEAAAAGGPGIAAVASPYNPSGQTTCWIMDTNNNKLTLYTLISGTAIRLVAVRNIEYDMKAHDFQNPRRSGPPVKEMKREADKAEKQGEDD